MNNSMNKNIIIVIVILLVAAGITYVAYQYVGPNVSSDQTTETALTVEEKEELVRTYIRTNISKLSPEPEVLGGTFTTSEFAFLSDSSGTVLYEDGHNLFLGTFEYVISDEGQVTITRFTAEKNPSFDVKG